LQIEKLIFSGKKEYNNLVFVILANENEFVGLCFFYSKHKKIDE
jgi:hypothetical protein